MNKQLQLAALFLFSIGIFSCKEKMKDKGVPTQIANAYGVNEFSKIKSIEFTFDLHKDSLHIERHWKWLPPDNTVIFYGKADSTRFTRMDTSTAELKKLNAEFTNDQYWLLFPFHLQWDEGYTFVDNDTATAPVTEKKYHKYTVQYNNKDGFTPGDMYQLYIDEQFIVHEWAYHKAAAKEPTLMMTWEDYEDFNGIKIAKTHKNKEGTARLDFTGIAVVK